MKGRIKRVKRVLGVITAKANPFDIIILKIHINYSLHFCTSSVYIRADQQMLWLEPGMLPGMLTIPYREPWDLALGERLFARGF